MQRRYYIGLLLVISIIVILSVVYITTIILGASGSISSSGSVTQVDMQGNAYSGDGVSFNIPTNWQVYKLVDGTNTNINIVKNNSNTTQITIAISPNPNDMSNQDIINMIQNRTNEDGNWEKISNNITSINGNTAYENTYKVTNSSMFNEPTTEEEIAFIKNGYTYTLIFQAPINEFNYEQTNFNITLNSFEVQ